MEVIRISWEPEDSWNIDGFRYFIKLLLSDDTKYEVFIISLSEDESLVNSIGTSLGLDEDHIIVCATNEEKTDAIDDNDIQIHLDNLQSFVLLVEETTEAYGILVNPNLNRFYLQPDYIVVFDRIVKRIENE